MNKGLLIRDLEAARKIETKVAFDGGHNRDEKKITGRINWLSICEDLSL